MAPREQHDEELLSSRIAPASVPASSYREFIDRTEAERARLNALLWGFGVPQMMHAMVKLGITELLADGPATVDELAQRSGTHAPSLYRLLRVALSVDLVAVKGDLFELTEGGQLLREDVPASMRNNVLWHGIKDLEMMVLVPGRDRTEQELVKLLTAAGLEVRSSAALPPPGRPFSLVTAGLPR